MHIWVDEINNTEIKIDPKSALDKNRVEFTR